MNLPFEIQDQCRRLSILVLQMLLRWNNVKKYCFGALKNVLPFSFEGEATKTISQGDIMVDKTEMDIIAGGGRSASIDNLAVLLWPRKLWRTRVVPYIISGHSYDSISKLFQVVWIRSLSVLYFTFRCAVKL